MMFVEHKIGELGCKMAPVFNLTGEECKKQALAILVDLEDNVLDYRFRRPELLLAALTHPSGRAHYQTGADYEKLEALGDAILDYIIGVNMMRNTMFERYLPQESDLDGGNGDQLTDEQKRKLLHYQVNPDYQPGDAH
jgi:hypothetical protein